MVDLAGSILSTSSGYAPPTSRIMSDTGARIHVDEDRNTGGAISENRPVSILHRSLAGHALRSFRDDYYNRVWVIPATIDLGTIASDTTTPLRLWNAWLLPVTITGLTETGSISGLSVAGPAIPDVMGALALILYNVVVTAAGDPVVNAEVIFALSTGEVRSVPVKGLRAILWANPFWPDWSDQVKVSFEYRTEVITSRLGYEQRRAYRQTPRKSIEFTVTAMDSKDDNHRAFRRLMQRGQNYSFILPEFTRAAFVAAASAAGGTAITLDSVPGWIVAGYQVVLATPEKSLICQVNSITGNQLNLSNLLEWDVPVGAKVMPALAGRLDDKISGRLLASFVSGHSIAYHVFAGSEPVQANDEGAAGQMFDGRELFLLRPNWIRDPSLDMIWPQDDVDFAYGLTDRFAVIDFPAQLIKASYLALNSAQAESIRQFYQRMKGMRGEFFMPTFENDIALRVIAGTGTNRLRAIGLDVYHQWVNASETFRAVLIHMQDGTYVAMKILNVVEVSDVLGDDSYIEFVSALPLDVGGYDTVSIDWLLLTRFATDTLIMGYETAQIAQVELAMQTVRYQEAE